MDPFMYKAATTGDIGFLQRIRDADVSADLLTQKTARGNNVLHLAAEFKKLNFFIDVPLDKRSPLFWAVNKMGDTPLHVCARVGCVEVVDFHIQHAKRLHARRANDQEQGSTYDDDDDDGDSYKKVFRKTNRYMHTALHVAVRYGNRGVANSLMEADPKLCCSAYSAIESPLFLATSRGFPNIALDILDESSVSLSFQGIKGVTALHAAATRKYAGAEGIVEIMVSKYPEQMKNVDALGWTPLHYAAFKGNLEAIRLLLQGDKFSTSYMVDKFGLSALHIAAYKGHLEVMKEIIQNQPDTCECRSSKGQTILHVAVFRAQSNVVEYIVNTPELAIRLVHQADKERHSPLHLAVISQNQEIIRTLTLDGGGNIDEEISLVFDNFLGDEIEVQEIIDGGYEGGSFGVSLFQEQINCDFKKLEYHPVNIFLDKNKCQESGKSAIVDDKKHKLALIYS